jgi:hypothetical protein
MKCSKDDPARQLNDARIVCTRGEAKAATVDIGAGSPTTERAVAIIGEPGIQEIGVVEYIEKFRAQFKFHPLGDGRGFGEGYVEVDITRTTQEVPRQGSICRQRWIGDHLLIRRERTGPRHARRLCGIRRRRALRVTKACRIEIQPAILANIQGIGRPDYVCMNVGGIARARRSFRSGIESITQPRKDVERLAGMPSDDWEEAPTLCQAFRPGRPHLIKRQIPTGSGVKESSYDTVQQEF